MFVGSGSVGNPGPDSSQGHELVLDPVLTLLGPLKTQMVELMGQPPLFMEQGFLGTQILPSPS